MAKITVIAVNKISGLEPPKKDKGGTLVEHTLEIGDEYQIEEEAAVPHIASGALVVKGEKAVEVPDNG